MARLYLVDLTTLGLRLIALRLGLRTMVTLWSPAKMVRERPVLRQPEVPNAKVKVSTTMK